ncbi:NFACT RNA binding domain-containing protein [Algoriphagus sp.]|uniref:NFACT RNA binding domain-containing protein n=1 Tax=Algoriphagus sp. TaxID=1872435 RepID=UPI002638E19D|nr:NFACT RNA binding domain-containing protein [Algoriphagus sp.]
MHLNYHFLTYLCPRLTDLLSGFSVTSCFSQNKDELIIGLENPNESRFFRAHLLAPQVYYSFPKKFQRAKKNSVDLFPELIGQEINRVQELSFERAFLIYFNSGDQLLVKLHGNRSNVVFFQKGNSTPLYVFRNELQEDKKLDWKELEKRLDLSKNRFFELKGNASQFLPTLGKIPREWLKERGYIPADLDKKWQLMQEVLDMLDTPLYAIAQRDSEVYLTLLPDSQVIMTFADPVEALNELFHKALVIGNFEKEKKELIKSYEDQIKRTKNYLEKSSLKRVELIQSPPPAQVADVIMANLHEFQKGQNETKLFNFYSNQTISISLKPNQKPQEFAAHLYRKSKNRKLEIQQLEHTISAKKHQLGELEAILFELQELRGFRDLKNFKKEHKSEKEFQKKPEGLPFRQFEVDGFLVWVGKSAKDNDEMLRNFTHKDDLWLHARQVAGSHVIIRKKGNQIIPDPVLERAGSLAAYYSKFKTERLAPVIYTEVKYVRKVKGNAPGAVIVDRESVLMVPPLGPDQSISISGSSSS